MEKLKPVSKRNQARAWKSWTFIIIVALVIAATLAGCAGSTTDYRGSRYYYSFERCPWDEGWMRIVEQTAVIQVLPWAEYRKAAWGHQVRPDSMAFQQGWAIWLKEGYTLDNKAHEISHIHDWRKGRSGHNPECWDTEKPYGYDKYVIQALTGAKV